MMPGTSATGLRLLIVLVNVSLFRGIGDALAAEESRFDQNMSLHPYFDFDVVRNVTARVGQTAFLNCRVEQLGDKSVSWIRKRDLHILTAGILTYTSDERFQVIRPENSDHWTLQIKFPQMRDSGIYECQVNTEPKMSMAFRLNVVEAKAEIHGPRDLYVKMGSLVTLSCKVSQGPHELGTIHWYRGSMPLDPKSIGSHPNAAVVREQPGRISIDTDWTDSLRSRLKVKSAKLSDSGNYSCLPTTAEGDSVTVHIINGEHPAAMQRGGAARGLRSPPVAVLLLAAAVASLLLLMWPQWQPRHRPEASMTATLAAAVAVDDEVVQCIPMMLPSERRSVMPAQQQTGEEQGRQQEVRTPTTVDRLWRALTVETAVPVAPCWCDDGDGISSVVSRTGWTNDCEIDASSAAAATHVLHVR